MRSVSPRRYQRAVKGQIGDLFTLALLFCICPSQLNGQTFNSLSDGSDGTFSAGGPPGTVVTFDPSQFHGTQASANIFNFTTITVQAGVTVRLSGTLLSGPVYWLAQGDVDIEGTIDLVGSAGHQATTNAFVRVPSRPGPGGYAGGVGGVGGQVALAGDGPGRGASGVGVGQGSNGAFPGNQFLIPLVGGSGGGGAQNIFNNNYFSSGGGAGGGALLMASSTRVILNGLIDASGGSSGAVVIQGDGCCSHPGGAGSGGSVRLISNSIEGSGTIRTNGSGVSGVTRLEAYAVPFSGTIGGTVGRSTPFPLLLPTAGPPTAKVISIGGTQVNPNPITFPDITINTASPVPVVIQTQNIPTTATVKLTILNQNGVPDTVIQAPPLGSCDQNNVCTTTVNVVFPFGASRGLTKVTWTP